MAFDDFVEKLENDLKRGSLSRTEARDLTLRHLRTADTTQITNIHHIIDGKGKKEKLQRLEVAAETTQPVDVLVDAVTTFFQRARATSYRWFKPTDYRLGVFWDQKELEKEVDLGSFETSPVRLHSSVFEKRTTTTRVQPDSITHKLEAESFDDSLLFSAVGSYRALLPSLVDRINPQFAELLLTQEDARLIARSLGEETFGDTPSALELALTPELKPTIVLTPFGQIEFGMDSELRVSIPVTDLDFFGAILGTNLVLENDEHSSRVVGFRKAYGIKNERISDLRTLAQLIGQHDLGLRYNCPLITQEQAVALLHQEVDAIHRLYYAVGLYACASPSFMMATLKRLAANVLGESEDSLADDLERFDVDAYVQFLTTKGYTPVTCEEIDLYKPESMREFYQGERTKGRYTEPFYNEPKWMKKHLHLLELIKQRLKADPESGAHFFRESYRNSAPELVATAHLSGKARSLRNVQLPSTARITSLNITERAAQNNYTNVASIGFCAHGKAEETAYVTLNVCPGRTALRKLQEYICDSIGLTIAPYQRE